MIRASLGMLAAWTVLTVSMAPALAATEPNTKAVTLSPPAMDFAAICTPAIAPTMQAAAGITAWDGRAAGRFDASTLYNHGRLLLQGNPVTPRNPEVAARIFNYLATAESPYQARARHYLAVMLQTGDGIAQDEGRAIGLLKSALAAGSPHSAYRLGLLALARQETTAAGEYFLLGATRNHATSALALAQLYASGKLPAPSTDAAATSAALAETLLLENLARGSCGALYNMGMVYDRGLILPTQPALAATWFEAAARTGNPRAMVKLAEYDLAEGTDTATRERGTQWLLQAAKLGSVKAQGRLGLNYLRGDGIAQDTTQAFYWLDRAAQDASASPAVLIKLGKMYATGEGTPRDAAKALALYKRAAVKRQPAVFQPEGMWYLDDAQRMQGIASLRQAAEQGNADAMFELGNAYSAGEGVDFSLPQAKYWWEKAANAGHQDAAALLKHLQN